MASFDSRELNAAIRKYLISLALSRTSPDSPLLPRWLSLYKSIRVNRVESTFDEIDESTGDPHINLCQKMVREKLRVLSRREDAILRSYQGLAKNFQAKGLSPICIKGFALAQDSSLPHRIRLYEDIDLLVEETRVKEYLELLYSQGYRTKFDSSKLDPVVILSSTGSLNLFNQHLAQSIDLHSTPYWRYLPATLEYQDILADARKIGSYGAQDIRIPSLPHHAILLLLEGTKDLWFRLDKVLDFWFCYFSLGERELHQFNQFVARNKMARSLKMACSLIQSILSADQPCGPSTQDMRHLVPITSDPRKPENKWIHRLVHGVANEWASESKRNAPREPFRTKAHIALIEPLHSKLTYLAKRATFATENDLIMAGFLAKIPGVFWLLRPTRKLIQLTIDAMVSCYRRCFPATEIRLTSQKSRLALFTHITNPKQFNISKLRQNITNYISEN